MVVELTLAEGAPSGLAAHEGRRVVYGSPVEWGVGRKAVLARATRVVMPACEGAGGGAMSFAEAADGEEREDSALIWIACDCGAALARRLPPDERAA